MARKRKRKKTGTKAKPQNAVLFHHPDAVDTGRERLMGRHAAGEGFLKGFVRHSGVDAFLCHGTERAHFDDFVRRVRALDTDDRPCHWVGPGEMAASGVTTMMLPDPSLGPLAWRRRITGGRGYSLCGINHTIASDTIMDALGELLTAPVQTWDAVICTSDAVKATIERLLDNWAEYLHTRTGGRITPALQLPVIPLGVDCDAFAAGDEAEAERQAIRRGLGVGEDDVAVLFMGRLSFHAKAHPTPLYLSLEEAAKRSGKRLHLLQAGWFANDSIEREFREGIRAHAPSVNPIFLDGREPDVRSKVWVAADIFTSLSDNIQETFGLTPIEAMAAGLPAVVSDWDGYRDTVRPGVDGFTIPTWMPLPQSGGDLALAPESRIGGAPEGAYDQYLGHVSQFTAIDVAAAADAFATLAGDEALRRQMGEAGRRRAREAFDWRVVVAAYQALWRELENIRNRDPEIAPATVERPAVPLRDDPFSLFAAYPSGTIDGDTVVALAEAEDGWARRLDAVGKRMMNVFAAGAMLGDDDQRTILGKLEKDGPLDVYALAELLPDERRYMLTRTVAWLAKVGIVGLEPGKGRGAEAKRAGALGGRPGSAMVELGIAARARGAVGPATRYFERALENDPDDPVANSQLGELMAYAGRLADARQRFERAADKVPDYQPPHRNLGRVLFLEGDYGAAREALDRARELKPDDAEATYLLGVCCRYAGEPKDARVHLEDSLALDDRRADAAAHLGLVHKSLGQGAEAKRAFGRALEKDPGNVLAGAALMSLEAEDGGRRALSEGGKRVGLFVHAKFHFPLLKPLFEAFAGGHWPLLSADARDLADFEPAATLICDAPVDRLRRLVPGTTTVNVRQGLAGRNFARRKSRHADFVCVTSEAMRDELVAAGALPGDRIWVTGFAPNDALFRHDPARPAPLPGGRKTVLYAPTHHAGLSSAPMLGDRVVALIAGERADLDIVIKPHPLICEYRPRWMSAWGRIAARDPSVRLVRDPAADVVPLLADADLLVSDASGVIFQYLALDRPMVLITNPERARDADHFDADAIEWRWRDMAEEVTDPAALTAAVDRALADPDARAEKRAQYRRLLYDDLDDGRAAERIVERVAAL